MYSINDNKQWKYSINGNEKDLKTKVCLLHGKLN